MVSYPSIDSSAALFRAPRRCHRTTSGGTLQAIPGAQRLSDRPSTCNSAHYIPPRPLSRYSTYAYQRSVSDRWGFWSSLGPAVCLELPSWPFIIGVPFQAGFEPAGVACRRLRAVGRSPTTRRASQLGITAVGAARAAPTPSPASAARSGCCRRSPLARTAFASAGPGLRLRQASPPCRSDASLLNASFVSSGYSPAIASLVSFSVTTDAANSSRTPRRTPT